MRRQPPAPEGPNVTSPRMQSGEEGPPDGIRSADFQVCCIAGFPTCETPGKIRRASMGGGSPIWKSAIQQVWKPALRETAGAKRLGVRWPSTAFRAHGPKRQKTAAVQDASRGRERGEQIWSGGRQSALISEGLRRQPPAPAGPNVNSPGCNPGKKVLPMRYDPERVELALPEATCNPSGVVTVFAAGFSGLHPELFTLHPFGMVVPARAERFGLRWQSAAATPLLGREDTLGKRRGAALPAAVQNAARCRAGGRRSAGMRTPGRTAANCPAGLALP